MQNPQKATNALRAALKRKIRAITTYHQKGASIHPLASAMSWCQAMSAEAQEFFDNRQTNMYDKLRNKLRHEAPTNNYMNEYEYNYE